ncbi:hypothetical protein [Aliiroseovarius crassostreae]|nr:hypothetical protein [Aliiroseovarius crassostreae]
MNDTATQTHHMQGVSPFERGQMVWPMTKELELEAAMVIWEEIDNCSQQYQSAQTTGEQLEAYIVALGAYRDAVGTAQLRNDAMPFIEPLHIAWELAYRQGEIAESFDWDFTPWFVANCISFSEQGLSLKPDWQNRARTYGAKDAA